MPALVAGIHEFVTSSRQDVDGRDKPGHDGTERQALELVGQADQSQLQRVAEIASVGKETQSLKSVALLPATFVLPRST